MIFVTGGYGFIGSNLVQALLDKGKSVTIVDIVQRPEYINNKNYFFLPIDDFYQNLSSYVKSGDIIFHQGAISSTVETDKKLLLKYNVDPSLNLVYFCRDNDIPLSYASSASVYGNLPREKWNYIDKPVNPQNLYSKCKRTIDLVVTLVQQSKKPAKLIQGFRYFNVYGKNENHKGNQSSPFHKFSEQLDKTGKIQLFEGSNKFYRDFVPVECVIDTLLFAIHNKPSGIYDLGSGSPKSFKEIAEYVCSKAGIKAQEVIQYIPMPEELRGHYQTYTRANMDWMLV